MADELTTNAAIGILRRGAQVLRFCEGLEEAAKLIARQQESMGGIEQALLDKRQELAQAERGLSERRDTMAADEHQMVLSWQRAQQEYGHRMTSLEVELEAKQRVVAVAKQHEDDDYLAQAKQHETRLAVLSAEIQDREGYLARLNQRIGALRADLDIVREV